MSGTYQDWMFKSESKGACQATRDSKCLIPRGKTIGGCSAVNLMYYFRGQREPYDRWSYKYNCTGWGFDDLLPYFKKSEGNTMNWNNSKYHNDKGPLRVSFFDGSDRNMNFFATAGGEMNPPIPTISDYNGGYSGQCYVISQSTTFNGRRWSAAKAFLIPVKNRKNYRIIQKAVVTRVLFNGTRAIGVEFFRNGIKFHAKAKKEVILSAGAIGSPILLQVSGIGPSKSLTENKIPIVFEQPIVGTNLADHVACHIWYEFPLMQTEDTLLDLTADIFGYNSNPRRLKFAGVGTLASIAFLSVVENGPAIIECYHFLLQKNAIELPELLRFLGYNDEVNKLIRAANSRGAIALVAPTVLEPASRGVVELQDGLTGVKAVENPNINFNFFSDQKNIDKKNLIKAMQDQIAREQTATYRKAGGKLIRMPYCFDQFKYGSYEFCECYIRYFSASIWHPTGTCPMGSQASNSVVDTNCSVQGVQGLRVVDASM